MHFLRQRSIFNLKFLGYKQTMEAENRGDFHQHLGHKGIAHYFIPKSSPTWDGAVERAHGVIDQEFYLNPTRPWKTLGEYIHFYNYRTHSSWKIFKRHDTGPKNIIIIYPQCHP